MNDITCIEFRQRVGADQVDRVAGNYPLDEMNLIVRTAPTGPSPMNVVARRTASGAFVGTFDFPLYKDHDWTGDIDATLWNYNDDNPRDNSAAARAG